MLFPSATGLVSSSCPSSVPLRSSLSCGASLKRIMDLESNRSSLVSAMFIRVKRKKTTFFIQCEPSETILEIKSKVQVLTDHDVDIQRLILVSNLQTLDDARSLADQRVENDAVVALTLKKEDGEWEEIDIEKPEDYQGVLDAEGS